MELKVKTPLVLAEGTCFIVSAYLDVERIFPIPSQALKAAILAFALGDFSHIKSLSRLDVALTYAMVYGGLVLSYVCEPIAPISRLYVDSAIRLEEFRESSYAKRTSDNVILKAWAHLVGGEEAVGLKMLEGLSVYPKRLAWRYPGSVRFSPSPINITATSKDLELLRLDPSYLDEIVRPWS
ncbi:MAG: hypothetical protein QXN05_03720 [Acidilobaceae archaeon]